MAFASLLLKLTEVSILDCINCFSSMLFSKFTSEVVIFEFNEELFVELFGIVFLIFFCGDLFSCKKSSLQGSSGGFIFPSTVIILY